jgi:NAD(P) transhydrogenase
MNTKEELVDILVIGGGPAGQKAAVQGAKVGLRVLLVERDAAVGGECVHRGTIPSKTLRESALYLSGLRSRSEGMLAMAVPADFKVANLMKRLKKVLASHERCQRRQLERNNIECRRGRAKFVAPDQVEVCRLDGRVDLVRAGTIVIATGSRPRRPSEIPIDHEHVLDSDSILSLIYLPQSLAVLGSGVIACEFASIFACLGVKVTMMDMADRPLAFLDRALTDRFQSAFERQGGTFLGGRKLESIHFDGLASVVTKLDLDASVHTEKVLCALGRAANVDGLNLAAAGLEVNARGHIEVDASCRTRVAHVFAVGDVIGPPALAATAMEQGRRAVRAALGLPLGGASESVPVGIYTIPEMASIGLTEEQANERLGGCVTGLAPFDELARGQISGNTEGLLKLVAGPDGRKLVGAHIVGEGATELIHVAQMAIFAGLDVDALIECIFNFPTLAEGFRVAALDVVGKRARHEAKRAA